MIVNISHFRADLTQSPQLSISTASCFSADVHRAVSAEGEEDESTTGAEGIGKRNLLAQFQEGKQSPTNGTLPSVSVEATSGAGSFSSLKTCSADKGGVLIDLYSNVDPDAVDSDTTQIDGELDF